MSRENDPRTEGRRKQKGGKHVTKTKEQKQMERDMEAAIDSLHEDDPTEVLVPEPDDAPKAKSKAKADKAPKRDQKVKAPKAVKEVAPAPVAFRPEGLPADLPDVATPFPMWKAQYFHEGKWYWSVPVRTINDALAMNHYSYKQVQEVPVWIDGDTERYIRPMTADEQNRFSCS